MIHKNLITRHFFFYNSHYSSFKDTIFEEMLNKLGHSCLQFIRQIINYNRHKLATSFFIKNQSETFVKK